MTQLILEAKLMDWNDENFEVARKTCTAYLRAIEKVLNTEVTIIDHGAYLQGRLEIQDDEVRDAIVTIIEESMWSVY